nr:TlpA family protein disulfide reductase [Pseudomonadota bacterium]
MNGPAMGIGTHPSSVEAKRGDFVTGVPVVRRRKLLLGAAGGTALMAGVLAQFWRSAPVQRDVAGVTVHAHPRELPPLRFSSESGTLLDLKAFGGRVVLLNIWATWCGPCREEMPTLDRLQALLGGPRFEVVALSIDGDGMAAVKPFFAQIGVRSL